MTRFVLAVAAVSLLHGGPVFAQGSDPAWLDDLTFQLLVEKQCEVSFLMNLQEGELGGEPTYEARVKCEDGRMFDASRIGRDGDFTFATCEEVSC